MKNFFLGIAVLILAIVLLIIIGPLGLVWGLVASVWKKNLVGGVSKIGDLFWSMAVSLDQFGNVLCAEMFNDILIRPDGYKFGHEDETVSSVLGKNKLNKTLSRAGIVLNWLLHIIDTNHSVNSIESDENLKK